MITTKDFIRKTLDPIEKLYAKEICGKVTNYIKFWDYFVGGRLDREQGMIVHHKLVFPGSYPYREKTDRDRIFKIFMNNFKILTNLAGSHYHLENLKKALNLKTGNKKRHFLHWESFEVAYIHLGNIEYNMDNIWNLLKKLDRPLGRLFEKQDIRSYLTNNRKTITLNQFNRLYHKDTGCITVYRDNFVHFSINKNLLMPDGYYYVPENLKKNLTWLNHPQFDRLVPTDVKLGGDLIEAEILFNRIEGVFYNILKNYVRNYHIKIRRSI
jgi:hypothetical protein